MMQEMEITSSKDEEREGFIAKVYGILTVQLLITSVFCFYAATEAGSAFFIGHIWIGYLMAILSFATLIPLSCSRELASSVPYNYYLLFIFTIAEGYLVGFGCSSYEPTSILIAVSLTAGIVLALSGYALYTKKDYTMFGGILIVLLFGLICLPLFLFFIRNPFIKTLYSVIGAIVFGCYIVVDTQMLIGEGQNKFSVDEYVMAAANIYLDIINMLLYILKLIGKKKS